MDKSLFEDVIYYNIPLNTEKEYSNKYNDFLSEAIYFIFKDSKSDFFIIEPAQVIYSINNLENNITFEPSVVPINSTSRVQFDKGLEKAINSFKFASTKKGNISFGGYYFLRPLRTDFMTLAKVSINNLEDKIHLNDDYYSYVFKNACNCYSNDFFKLLEKDKDIYQNFIYNFKKWLASNKIEKTNIKIYTPHFSYFSLEFEEFV